MTAQAEALINQRLGAAPKSAYAMAQTIVVQNEALKRELRKPYWEGLERNIN